MYGLPNDIDLSFFVGQTLNMVSFAVNMIHFNFDEGIGITVQSTFQHQQKFDVESNLVGTFQSVHKIQNSSLMRLAGNVVASASAGDDGTLSITFDNGDVLHCFDDDKGYECYNFTDGKKLWIV